MHLTPKQFFIVIILLALLHIYLLLRCRHAELPLNAWPETTSRNISLYINLDVKNLLTDFCTTPTTLLILVHSHPRNKAARAAIRRTWGDPDRLTKTNALLFFLLGETRNPPSTREIIMAENLEHGDIIVEDFIDNYANLTLKSVSMLKLFQSQNQCRFLLKADDDLFVNVEKLVRIMHFFADSAKEKLLMGRAIWRERRQNDYYDRWYAPRYMFLGRTYPNFLAGPAYVMSLQVAKKLYKAALELPLFHLEDVFLTGICAKKVGIRPQDLPLFTDYGVPKGKCVILRLITMHGFRPKEIFRVQRLLERAQNNYKCSLEYLRSLYQEMEANSTDPKIIEKILAFDNE
ncbi:hypothetical protein Zmor_012850 [Zophobas morio]|uniref:Hexosyltransferase n=2 Tax=Zophobas morio TaxID=2755281 RepID=A0AA38IGS6_9CUCU|nr:hypothetical protein Zmor_012850 [Zophobas morio]